MAWAAGDYVTILPGRHSLAMLEDAAVLVTIVSTGLAMAEPR